ncbi:MAG TPA: hypothetical protein VFI25_10690 [Planctomycetota bacterium]|jgi:hypothetical protein|nr:hypothetical protein [Planctomycetota bacterium]
MDLERLDSDGARRQAYVEAALAALGVNLAEATIMRASPQGEEKWELWIATDLGLIVATHDPGRGEIGPHASLRVSEVTPWDSVGPLTATATTTRWERSGIGTELKVAFHGRDFTIEIGPGARDDFGQAAFFQACLTRHVTQRGALGRGLTGG